MSDAAIARERKIILLLAAVSFVNILDFVMVIPLGPEFARGLGTPTSRLGLLGTSYTGAAALAGLVGTLFLDRFDRRSALTVAMLGLVTATAAGGLARSFDMLLGARVVAGVFGGPATSIGLAILTDVIAPERRGKALGQVMGAFSVASVVGVPMSIVLASWAGWRVPFFVVAGLGLLLVVGALFLMPPMRGHLERPRVAVERRSLATFAGDPTGGAGADRDGLPAPGQLRADPEPWPPGSRATWALRRETCGSPTWWAGSSASRPCRWGGRLVDRKGSLPIILSGSVLFVVVVAISFLPERSWLPVMGVFVGFMLANSFRMVAMNTLSTRVPLPSERARFMSAQSAAQHTAAAAAGAISTRVLTNAPGGALLGMNRLGMLSIVLTAVVPAFVWVVTVRLRRRETAAELVQAPAR
jgi:predicted MFS family arabinose efflux permease